MASDGRWALNVQNASSGNLVRNKVFYSEHSFRGAISISMDSLPGFSSDRNAMEDRFTLDDGNSVLDFAEWQSMTGQDTSSFTAVPGDLFLDLPGDDYHPREDSPLLDVGETLVEVPTDIEGTPRPLGSAYDIGAYEGTGVVFSDGFESGNASRWSSSSP